MTPALPAHAPAAQLVAHRPEPGRVCGGHTKLCQRGELRAQQQWWAEAQLIGWAMPRVAPLHPAAIPFASCLHHTLIFLTLLQPLLLFTQVTLPHVLSHLRSRSPALVSGCAKEARSGMYDRFVQVNAPVQCSFTEVACVLHGGLLRGSVRYCGPQQVAAL